MKLETVEIVSGDSFIVINKSDFDKDKHKIYKAKPAKKSVPK